MSRDTTTLITLELSPAAAALVAESGDEPTVFFRKAAALYVLAKQAQREGKAVGTASSAAVLETEFVGI